MSLLLGLAGTARGERLEDQLDDELASDERRTHPR